MIIEPKNVLKYILNTSTLIIKMSDDISYNDVIRKWYKLVGKRPDLKLQTFKELNVLETLEYVLLDIGGFREVRKKQTPTFYNYVEISQITAP